MLWEQRGLSSKVDAIVSMYSCAYAFGSIKREDFNKFIDTLDPTVKKNVGDAIEKMKDMGLPIEDN